MLAEPAVAAGRITIALLGKSPPVMPSSGIRRSPLLSRSPAFALPAPAQPTLRERIAASARLLAARGSAAGAGARSHASGAASRPGRCRTWRAICRLYAAAPGGRRAFRPDDGPVVGDLVAEQPVLTLVSPRP